MKEEDSLPTRAVLREVRAQCPVESGKVKATYKNGVLEIHLPKSEAVKPKEIKIEVM